MVVYFGWQVVLAVIVEAAVRIVQAEETHQSNDIDLSVSVSRYTDIGVSVSKSSRILTKSSALTDSNKKQQVNKL